MLSSSVISLILCILIEYTLLAVVIWIRIIEALLHGSVKRRFVCCILVERILSFLKILNSFVYILLRSVWILRKFVCLLNSFVIRLALCLVRVLVSRVGFSHILCTLIVLARVHLTMLSNSSVKLILVSGVLIKLLTRSIELCLSIVNSLLRGILVFLYLIGFSQRVIVSCLGFLSSFVLGGICIAVSILEVRLSNILIFIACLRTSCSLLTLSRCSIFINRLIQLFLLGSITIKSLARLIQSNSRVINLSLKLFG
ncbi:Uncharacterised protein [Chlamydia trachomatis]|nr:Uncharacterised protein [Chlamydia trachomatis]